MDTVDSANTKTSSTGIQQADFSNIGTAADPEPKIKDQKP
jgi:hypothetical protein